LLCCSILARKNRIATTSETTNTAEAPKIKERVNLRGRERSPDGSCAAASVPSGALFGLLT
jgi:hypothetical protein